MMKQLSRNKKIEDIFIQNLNAWKTNSEIVSMYNAGISPLQVIQLWLFETKNNIRYAVIEHNSEKILPFKLMKISVFATRLKKYIQYTNEQRKKFLSQCQEMKIKYKHLDKSDEEITQLVKKQLGVWANNAHNKRKEKQFYSYDNKPEYWMTKLNISYDDALAKVTLHKKEKSPFAVEHWIKKGYKLEDAVEIIRKNAAKGGINATKKCESICTSSLERDIYNEIIKIYPDAILQFSINDVYVYDICVVQTKKIIEINGTYWHADKRVYDDNATVYGKNVAQIHAADEKKRGYAIKNGYEVLTIWELDIRNERQKTLSKSIEFLSNGQK